MSVRLPPHTLRFTIGVFNPNYSSTTKQKPPVNV
jgi:hypothetical protein